MNVEEEFGRVDIYVFDQIWRGNIAPGMRVLDAGCGGGRNLVWLLRQGAREVYGCDASEEAIERVRTLEGARAENFRVAAIERMPYADGFAEVVLCSSVLHFARDEGHFRAMVRELWRVLGAGGLLFVRVGSRMGGAGAAGAEGWFLVDEALLLELTEELGGELVDPLKTTVVQGVRSMTTWVLRKGLGNGRDF